MLELVFSFDLLFEMVLRYIWGSCDVAYYRVIGWSKVKESCEIFIYLGQKDSDKKRLTVENQ